jgi:hypothetical protein
MRGGIVQCRFPASYPTLSFKIIFLRFKETKAVSAPRPIKREKCSVGKENGWKTGKKLKDKNPISKLGEKSQNQITMKTFVFIGFTFLAGTAIAQTAKGDSTQPVDYEAHIYNTSMDRYIRPDPQPQSNPYDFAKNKAVSDTTQPKQQPGDKPKK